MRAHISIVLIICVCGGEGGILKNLILGKQMGLWRKNRNINLYFQTTKFSSSNINWKYKNLKKTLSKKFDYSNRLIKKSLFLFWQSVLYLAVIDLK